MLFHCPQEHLETILTEEWFALEHHCRHSPVPCSPQCVVILFEVHLVTFRISIDGFLKLGQIEACTGGRVGEVVPLILSPHAIPQERRNLPTELDCAVTVGGSYPEPAKAACQRLICSN